MQLYPLLQDSLGMFLLIGKPIGSNDFPVSCHLQRCRLGIYFQVHRSRNQTSLRIANSSRLFHLAEEMVPSRSLAIEFSLPLGITSFTPRIFMPEKAVEAAFGGILEFTLMTFTPSRLAKANSPNSGVPSIVMFSMPCNQKRLQLPLSSRY